jgi:hypothetical protein
MKTSREVVAAGFLQASHPLPGKGGGSAADPFNVVSFSEMVIRFGVVVLACMGRFVELRWSFNVFAG